METQECSTRWQHLPAKVTGQAPEGGHYRCRPSRCGQGIHMEQRWPHLEEGQRETGATGEGMTEVRVWSWSRCRSVFPFKFTQLFEASEKTNVLLKTERPNTQVRTVIWRTVVSVSVQVSQGCDGRTESGVHFWTRQDLRLVEGESTFTHEHRHLEKTHTFSSSSVVSSRQKNDYKGSVKAHL